MAGWFQVFVLSTSYPFSDPPVNISFEVGGGTLGAGVIWVSVEPCPSGPAQACLSGRGAGLRWPLGCRGSGGRPRSPLLHHFSCITIFTWLLPTSPASRGQLPSSQSHLLAGAPIVSAGPPHFSGTTLAPFPRHRWVSLPHQPVWPTLVLFPLCRSLVSFISESPANRSWSRAGSPHS